jgi:hypothetical protein
MPVLPPQGPVLASVRRWGLLRRRHEMVATEFVMQPQCEPNVVSVSEIVRSKGDKHPPPRLGGHWPVTYPRERARARPGGGGGARYESSARPRLCWMAKSFGPCLRVPFLLPPPQGHRHGRPGRRAFLARVAGLQVEVEEGSEKWDRLQLEDPRPRAHHRTATSTLAVFGEVSPNADFLVIFFFFSSSIWNKGQV